MRIEDLPEKYQQQALDQLGDDEQRKTKKRSRKVAASDATLRCCTPDCEFPPTTNLTAMERHADSAGHHRYEVVLDGGTRGDAGVASRNPTEEDS